MASPRSSAGDPETTLSLLWRSNAAPRRGPARGLQLDELVGGATALADSKGLDAVTMRALATALGVTPMALYTYVPGRAELVDLMLDTAYQRLARPDLSSLRWQERVAAVAAGNRGLYERHPWASTVSTLRPPLGPGLMAKYEHELTAFDGLGLTDLEMDDALTYLLSFVQANARDAHDARAARHESAMNDEQWWHRNEPLLRRVLDPQAYPLASRVGTAAGTARGSAHDPDRAFDFGLARVIDGLAALIGPRAGPF